MGLDMYLHEVAYISRYRGLAEADEGYKAQFAQADRILDLAGLHKPDVDGSVTVRSTVAYWRKDNQIHNWFVQNCGDGRDDCQTMYVDTPQLVELRDRCVMLLEKRSKSQAEAFLPPVSGFFFGGTEIDEWYWRGLEDTVRMLTDALDNQIDNSWFEYEASW